VVVAVVAVPVESAIAGKRLALIEPPQESPAQTSALQGHYAARAGSSPENGMIKRAAFNIERLTFRLGTPPSRHKPTVIQTGVQADLVALSTRSAITISFI